MQNVTWTGRLAADPYISADGNRAAFRLLENRGRDAEGRPIVNGVNCVAFGAGFVDNVVAPGLAKGCEAVVIGHFQDRTYTGSDGVQRATKELVVDECTILDWAADREQRRAA